MKRLANGEYPCPVDGCGTGLQRSIGGSVVDGVLAHLSVVHGLPVATAQIKYSEELAAIGGPATYS